MELGMLAKKEKLTDSQILEKAIQKAIDNGWKQTIQNSGFYLTNDMFKFTVGDVSKLNIPVERIIYNHGFAKALWGWDTITIVGEKRLKKPYSWQYHLQQMVIADDPIKYLGKTL